jgi:hypothetical protein
MSKKLDFESIRRAFINDLNVDVKESRYNSIKDFNGIEVEALKGTASNKESEWIVFASEKDSENYAKFLIKNDLESNPEIFEIYWLSNFISISHQDIDTIVQDEIEWHREDDDIRELEDELENATNPKEIKRIEKAIEKWEDDLYRDLYDRIEDDPIYFMVEETGWYTLQDLLKSPFIRIDIDKASQDAVDIDGIDHFLDNYDGRAELIYDDERGKYYIVYGTN